MRISAQLTFAVALGLCWPINAAGQERYLHTDSIGAQLIETSHVLHCEGLRASVGFVENARPEDSGLDLIDRQRVTLIRLSVSGRSIPSADMRLVEQQFHRFAWIERVTVRCARFHRRLQLIVTGMLAEAWAARAEGRLAERPDTTSIFIRVAENGSTRIE